jgi:hypothetical protein
MAKKLSKKQLRVIEELFAGELGEQAVLDKYKISRKTFNRWLADECFVEQFNERVEKSFRQSRLIIARYAPLAAAKLVELTASDKEETARKACLDIISMHTIPHKSNERQVTGDEISPETASKILAALAEEES